MVRLACTTDTAMVAYRMKSEMGSRNSSRPFFRKCMWIRKARRPPALSSREITSPAGERRSISTSP